MGGELGRTVVITERESEYDAAAKRLLANPKVLGRILVATIDEFQGMEPAEAANYIVGKPEVSTVSVDPGATNKKDEESGVMVLNTEDGEFNELFVRYDIIFYVRMRDGISRMIINVEAQRKQPDKYQLVNRAIFYVARMISSQKGRDFFDSKYDDMKRVHSIWICMNMDACELYQIGLKGNHLLGQHEWGGMLDLINIVMVGLPKMMPEKREE